MSIPWWLDEMLLLAAILLPPWLLATWALVVAYGARGEAQDAVRKEEFTWGKVLWLIDETARTRKDVLRCIKKPGWWK